MTVDPLSFFLLRLTKLLETLYWFFLFIRKSPATVPSHIRQEYAVPRHRTAISPALSETGNSDPEPLCSIKRFILPSTYTSNLPRQDRAMQPPAQPLDLPELLAMILLHVPVQDLLFQQRVNKTGEGVIKRTPSLRQNLFLSADFQDTFNEYSVVE